MDEAKKQLIRLSGGRRDGRLVFAVDLGSRRKRRHQVQTLERELGVKLPDDVRWVAECDGLSRSLGRFVDFLTAEMKYHLGFGPDPRIHGSTSLPSSGSPC